MSKRVSEQESEWISGWVLVVVVVAVVLVVRVLVLVVRVVPVLALLLPMLVLVLVLVQALVQVLEFQQSSRTRIVLPAQLVSAVAVVAAVSRLHHLLPFCIPPFAVVRQVADRRPFVLLLPYRQPRHHRYLPRRDKRPGKSDKT